MWAPPNTRFIGLLRVHTPNGLSIGLLVTSRQTDINFLKSRETFFLNFLFYKKISVF